MNFETPFRPCVTLPLRLRIRFALNCLMRFAAFSSIEKGAQAFDLERLFKETISREYATISKICFSYACSVAEFEDLRQDALINIWRGLQGFRSDASLRTWIYRVTVNSCLTTIRKQSRHRHESLDGLYSLIESEEPEKEEIEKMHQIIGMLGAQEKAIIMMWLDEFTYDEIAAAMGLNRNTVATKVRRIKDKITRLYKEDKL